VREGINDVQSSSDKRVSAELRPLMSWQCPPREPGNIVEEALAPASAAV
jgi:hypothetical protein